jgi:multiple sugar transport system permease protein
LLVFIRGITAAKKSAGEKGFGLTLPLSDWQIFLSFFWQNGGKLLASGTSGEILSEEAAVDTIKYLKQYFDEKLTPLEIGKDMDLLNAFEMGFFPVFISGPYMISELERNKPGLNGKWTTARMPTQKSFTSFIGGCNLVIFKESRNKDLAWKFIEFLSTAENQAKWYEISKGLPACRKSWEYPALTENQHLKAFKEQLEDTCAPPSIPEWEQIAGAFTGTLEEIMYNKKTPEEGVQAIKLQITNILRPERAQQSAFFKIVLVILFLVIPFVGLWAYFKYAPKERDRMSNKAYSSAAIWFLMPALTILTIFMIIPIYGAFVSSLTNWNMYGISDPSKVVFVGLDNYLKLMSDPIFWIALRNTLIFAFFGVPLSISLSLAMALLLNQQFIRFKAFFRVGFFIPVITTMVAVALIWRWLYNPEFGLLNLALGYLGIPGQNWLTDPILALPSLIFMSVWKGFGYNMIIFIAALQGISDSLYEAAEIDGADQTQQFWHITLPMLRNTTFFVGMMTSIGYLQFFAEPYIMTGGGPLNATMSVVLYMYQHGFKYYNLGYASSIAYALFGMIFICTLIQGRIRKSLEGSNR